MGTEITGKLEEILLETLDISEKSNGALDPTIGEISRLWDIDGENPRVPAEHEITELLKTDGYKNVVCKNQKAFAYYIIDRMLFRAYLQIVQYILCSHTVLNALA